MSEFATPFNSVSNPAFWEKLTDTIADKVTSRMVKVMKETKPRYYGRKEVAKILHLSLPTVSRLTADGILIGHNVNGRILYDAAAIDKAVSENEQFKRRKK